MDRDDFFEFEGVLVNVTRSEYTDQNTKSKVVNYKANFDFNDKIVSFKVDESVVPRLLGYKYQLVRVALDINQVQGSTYLKIVDIVIE